MLNKRKREGVRNDCIKLYEMRSKLCNHFQTFILNVDLRQTFYLDNDQSILPGIGIVLIMLAESYADVVRDHEERLELVEWCEACEIMEEK